MMPKLKQVTLIAAASALLSGPAMATTIMTGDLSKLTVFSDNIMTTGQNTQILGNVTSGGVGTTGAGSHVVGNFITGGAANVGASIVGGSQTTISVGGYISSGGLVTTGDGSIVKGDITGSGAVNIGANATAGGNVTSGDVGTEAASAKIVGNFTSFGAGTVGGLATVGGNLVAGGSTTVSADATVSGTKTANSTAASQTVGLTDTILAYVKSVASQVFNAQATLTAMGAGFQLAATITDLVHPTVFGAGVYSAANLSTTDGTTIQLDAKNLDNQMWVFNIADYLSFGANSTVKIINGGKNEQVFWNVGSGFAKTGDSAKVVGTILAKDYVMVGAGAVIASSDNSCGAVFSQTSTVTTGADAIIGGDNCVTAAATPLVTTPPALVTPTSIPEPATYMLMLAGLGLMGFMVRRKKSSGEAETPQITYQAFA